MLDISGSPGHKQTMNIPSYHYTYLTKYADKIVKDFKMTHREH